MNAAHRRRDRRGACGGGARARLSLLGLGFVPLLAVAHAADVSLTVGRKHFTVAEPLELAVTAHPAALQIRHADGSSLTLNPKSGPVLLRPYALKPGKYVASAGGKAAEFTLHPDEHPSAYFTGEWTHTGDTPANAKAKGGWMYLTTAYGHLQMNNLAEQDAQADGYVSGRMRPYQLMVLGGGHQLDLDIVNDWGDPWVQRAVIWRMQLAALKLRPYPLAGLHCYDEPGLTWWPNKGPYAIPHQLEEFKNSTGQTIPDEPFEQAAPKFANMLDAWLDFMDLRMKYLEQCWAGTVWATDSVHPAFETLNQVSSSYAPGDATDGVDCRQDRPYRIVSGHGGYSDLPFGTYQPICSAESFRGFGWENPHVYLPTWYTHSWETIRNGIWASWATKLEGMLYTPEQNFLMTGQFGYHGTNTVFEIAELNRRLALVGGVMNQLKKSPSPVAVLWSHRQMAWDIAKNNSPALMTDKDKGSPQYASAHREAVSACFFRILETGIIPNYLHEVEVTEKGAAFLKQWKVVFCPALATATPVFQKALEEYAASGGKLIQFKGDALALKGAIVADHSWDYGSRYWNQHKAGDNLPPALNRDLAWREWNRGTAPTFAQDLREWLGPQPYSISNKEILLGVHTSGGATYLLMANNAQDPKDARLLKWPLIPAAGKVKLPAGGVVYDLFNGGAVPVQNGEAELRLGAGDGACWMHLPQPPGAPQLAVKAANEKPGTFLELSLTWGQAGYLPFRLRILDPSGNRVDELYRATTPQEGRTVFAKRYPLGANPLPGEWKVEVSEWLTGQTVSATAKVQPAPQAEVAYVEADSVTVRDDDAKRIAELFAGKAAEPPYAKLNWDAKRVFNLDPKKFAVFGPADAAQKVAAALTAKGMTVQVNPPYAIEKFKRAPDRGGAGPVFREENYENIHAHAVVLPDHPLLQVVGKRLFLNRKPSDAFPGPGRAYVQWGVGCFQAGWHNVFVLGDANAGVSWLLQAMEGKTAEKEEPCVAQFAPAPAAPARTPAAFAVKQQIPLYDTPVGVGSAPDGSVTYVLLFDGSVTAYDRAGKALWTKQVLQEGGALAVSPQGHRVAVAGYPGFSVLDAKDGRALGEGYQSKPVPVYLGETNRIRGLSWNSKGMLVAGGWCNNQKAPEPLVVLDAEGKRVPAPDPKGNVMGVAFVPNTDTLLVGAGDLTAVDAARNQVLWSAPIKCAQAFAVSADGKLVAAGGWGDGEKKKKAGVVELSSGKVVKSAEFDAIVGGVAFLPSGDLAVAVWGGTHPLYVLQNGSKEGKVLFQSDFAFQDVLWSAKHQALVAAEQGGRLWLLDADGKPKGVLDETAGTTPYRLAAQNGELLVARMNRVVQRLEVNAGGR